MSRIFQFYNRVLKQHPTITPALSTGVFMCTGDVVSQLVIEKRGYKDYQYVRTLRFTGLGIFLVGPAITLWYRALAKYIGEKGTKQEAVKKVILDQLLFAPSFLPVFLTALGSLQGQNISQIKNFMKERYFDIIITNYKVWPLVQVINFYVLPTRYQVLLTQTVAIFWNTYLSWETHRTKARD